MKRTHHCNELRLEHTRQEVTLSGWVHSCRDLGGVIFIDIRDREGRTQVVFDPQDSDPTLVDIVSKLHSESVISVSGRVPSPENGLPGKFSSRCARVRPEIRYSRGVTLNSFWLRFTSGGNTFSPISLQSLM